MAHNITTELVEELAPDQASLKAASKLMKAAKWPVRQRCDDHAVIWGECQGSGSNPYRVVVDSIDHGYKCSCPSRKFPCKHTLALMWQFAEDEAGFSAAEPVDWVSDWLGRLKRKNTAGQGLQAPKPKKSISLAAAEPAEKVLSAEEVAKREAAKLKRLAQTNTSISDGLNELEQWLDDQLRTGIGALLTELADRCRRIAARLVDAKAASLASRLDELPARVLDLPSEEQGDALLQELAALVLLIQAWRSDLDDPDHRAAIATGIGREQLLADEDALRVSSLWLVVGERLQNHRDGLVSQATWLLDTQSAEPRFALLLDFFPASIGNRSAAFVSGELLQAELVYFSRRQPLRVLIAQREASPAELSTPSLETLEIPTDVLQPHSEALHQYPWSLATPLVLGAGRICETQSGQYWWRSDDGEQALPLSNRAISTAIPGLPLQQAFAIWNGHRADVLSVTTAWGLEVLNG